VFYWEFESLNKIYFQTFFTICSFQFLHLVDGQVSISSSNELVYVVVVVGIA